MSLHLTSIRRRYRKVRLGAFAPTLAPTADAGKVRLGAFAPTLAPTADAKKVRLGASAKRRLSGAIVGVVLGIATLALSGCGTSGSGGTEKGVYSAAISLTAADQAALQYVVLPLCGPTHPKPLCSEAAVSAKIKSAAQSAHDAVKAAEAAPPGDTAALSAANAAIAALVALTPKT